MRSCISFVGLLAVGHCDHISRSSNQNRNFNFGRTFQLSLNQGGHDPSYYRRTSSPINHPAIAVRGGGSIKSSSSSSGSSTTTTTTQLDLSATATMASLFAGSLGGAIGVGISYPFDTLSTKAQVRSTGRNAEAHLNFVRNMGRIWKNEGMSGFFEGVLVTMIGQAVIKAIQFAVNEITFMWLEAHSSIQSNVMKLAISGTLAGLLSSFVVSPVELIKIRMQAQDKKKLGGSNKKDDDDDNGGGAYIPSVSYDSELDCARWIVKNEGWGALFSHGLLITIIREIPSFAFYFVAYGVLARSAAADLLGGHAAPLIFGAIAGWAMWIPTYPIDIVKTIVQVQTREKGRRKEGRAPLSLRQITAKLYRSGGIMTFFDGLEPKLARAAVKHAVTFWVYEVLMDFFR